MVGWKLNLGSGHDVPFFRYCAIITEDILSGKQGQF